MAGMPARFVLEVDLSAPAVAADPVKELGRILRYWAGNLHHYPLAPGDTCAVSDSTYAEVGSWRIVEPPQE
jgi:hypothetical protein